jgi:transposase
VYRWKADFERGGAAMLASGGPPGQRCKLSVKSQAKPAAMLDEGPAAFGWDEDQVWAGARVARLIGRKFHISYSPSAATRLMRRLGFTPQRPARRAVQRDDQVCPKLGLGRRREQSGAPLEVQRTVGGGDAITDQRRPGPHSRVPPVSSPGGGDHDTSMAGF